MRGGRLFFVRALLHVEADVRSSLTSAVSKWPPYLGHRTASAAFPIRAKSCETGDHPPPQHEDFNST
eukprot:2973054-Amphidinium_carterae.1